MTVWINYNMLNHKLIDKFIDFQENFENIQNIRLIIKNDVRSEMKDFQHKQYLLMQLFHI